MVTFLNESLSPFLCPFLRRCISHSSSGKQFQIETFHSSILALSTDVTQKSANERVLCFMLEEKHWFMCRPQAGFWHCKLHILFSPLLSRTTAVCCCVRIVPEQFRQWKILFHRNVPFCFPSNGYKENCYFILLGWGFGGFFFGTCFESNCKWKCLKLFVRLFLHWTFEWNNLNWWQLQRYPPNVHIHCVFVLFFVLWSFFHMFCFSLNCSNSLWTTWNRL